MYIYMHMTFPVQWGAGHGATNRVSQPSQRYRNCLGVPNPRLRNVDIKPGTSMHVSKFRRQVGNLVYVAKKSHIKLKSESMPNMPRITNLSKNNGPRQ